MGLFCTKIHSTGNSFSVESPSFTEHDPRQFLTIMAPQIDNQPKIHSIIRQCPLLLVFAVSF